MLNLLILINMSRQVALMDSSLLDQRAQIRAEYLCTHPFSHNGWKTSFIGLNDKWEGENLARNFPNDLATHEALMASPTHRANILDSNYTQLGVGRACGVTVELFSN